MKTTEANPLARCPACQKSLGAAAHPSNASPSPGDITICLYCGQVSMFQTDLTLRAMHAAEIETLAKDTMTELDVARFIARGFQVSRLLEDLGRDYGLDLTKPPKDPD